jgi:hypothetical protein
MNQIITLESRLDENDYRLVMINRWAGNFIGFIINSLLGDA